jgi:type VI protein secretion system component Hcp
MAGSFLQIKGIKGKSRQEGRAGKEWLDVSTWNIGAHIHVDADSSKGSLTTGQSYITDLTCGITIDSSVVNQFAACLGGRHFEKAVLEVTKDVSKSAGETKTVVFLKIAMEDVIISSNGLSGHTGSEPNLTVSVKFSRYKMTYTLYDEKGNVVETGEDGFDLIKHKNW